MTAALIICVTYGLIVWLVFFKFKLIKFTITWGVVSFWVGLHLLLVILIGLRFVTPYTTNAKVVQYTVQLIPRLPEPTVVTEVLVTPNVPVKKGQPLFQFDRRLYEYNVRQLQAQLVEAKQNVLVLKADLDAAVAQVAKEKSELKYAKFQVNRYRGLARTGAGSEEEFQKWTAKLAASEASVEQANADEQRARAKYGSQIDGVNTTVASLQAQLEEAQYYLEQTTMVAPEDGFVTNLQVRPGMVAGIVRVGAIASFVVAADRYVLGEYFQEHLQYIREGQPVEVALDIYPGRIFPGSVERIWWATGAGQFLPSGRIPTYHPVPKPLHGRFAVKIVFDDKDQTKFPIGAQGAAAIYTEEGGFAVLRRIVIRIYSYANWLFPLPI